MNQGNGPNIDFKSIEDLKIKPNLSIGKLLFLAALAAALTTLPIINLFAAIPLMMAILLYGRKKGYAVSLLYIALLLGLVGVLEASIGVFNIFVSVLITEIILRSVHPMRGVIRVSLVLSVIFVSMFAGLCLVEKKGPVEYVNSMVTVSLTKLKEQNPEQLKQKITSDMTYGEFLKDKESEIKETFIRPIKMPSTIFAGLILYIWFSIFLILRNSMVWRLIVQYPYASRDLLQFRMPDFYIYFVIIGLALTVAGEYLLGSVGELIGLNIVITLGVFYFFQGLGIFLEFLNKLRVFGFLRLVIVSMTVFTAHFLIAAIGVFDYWLNFRSRMKQNNN